MLIAMDYSSTPSIWYVFARALLPLYLEVDADLAIAGILLHDIGKLEEYEGDFAARVSRVGILQGHVVLGFRVVRKARFNRN